ncbi:hypothetical protein ANCCEY_01915 [Ancylostoma ceylanicum]|uniref:SCP domain-containing protein n=1 Tax=Ancylostoma ceylanicum TaxID=53326 RepID=A0A0D6M4A1_9BILA|nr:hypothetical protein ANCCEY_01915 [Ancylostoma ceylanicum]
MYETAIRRQKLNDLKFNIACAFTPFGVGAWNCDLEKAAIDTLSGRCEFKDDLSDKNGRATVFFQSYGFEGPVNTDIIKTVFANGLDGIDQFILEGVSSNKVIYKSDTVDGLRLYVNVIRPKATEIGCALTKCKDEGDPFAIYCIMNAKKLNGGDIVYEA